MKKFISLLTVVLFLFVTMPVFADNPQLEKFGARWVDQNQSQFQVFAIVNIAGVGNDFFFSWSASGTPVKKVCHYGGRAELKDGQIIGNKWYFKKIYENRMDFPALQFYGLAREDEVYSKKEFNLLPKKTGLPVPYVPSNPSPADNATGQKEIIVHWSGGDPNELPVTYTVLWGYTQPVNSYQLVTTDTFAVLSNWKKFPENKIFYWRVIADNGFEKVSGPTWSFDTYDKKLFSSEEEYVSNYPNPFNPVTTISYKITQDANVSLTVYNMVGQQVTTLVNKWQQSGQHEVKFNASNLASGTYFYRLQIGSKNIIKKMFLLK